MNVDRYIALRVCARSLPYSPHMDILVHLRYARRHNDSKHARNDEFNPYLNVKRIAMRAVKLP